MANCTWPISYQSCADCTPLTSLPVSGQAMFEEMAVDFLRSWTSPFYGLCEVELRPCRQRCEEGRSTFWGSGPFPSGFGPWRPVIINGLWYNLTCGLCGERCSCKQIEQITLPGPIDSIVEVVIDGVPVPSGSYRVDNRKYLVRTDGSSWPQCQDMEANLGDPNTWAVTYVRGIPVPVGGQIAAGILACEFAKAACGDGTCQLPKRVTSVSRQGVTFAALLDTFDDLRQGGTGIWLVDNWVATVTRGRSRSRVWSPDLVPKGRRTTWP